MADFILIGTGKTPTGLGVMQLSHMIYPICGECFNANPFYELEQDGLFECSLCGHNYGELGTCDTAIHTTASVGWIRYAVSKWTGIAEDHLDVKVDFPS